jgi:demethylmenaquinone methyltransferase / 2-methoxy-6-polyprenyl-1,4-benzoquinol methylase
MNRSSKNIPGMFNRIASDYDRANRLLSLGLDMHWRRMLAKHLPQGRLSLLDLATGTGAQIDALFCKNAPISNAIGIDLSAGMLEIAKKKFMNDPRASFQLADAQNLPFPSETFDLSTLSFGIRNIEHPLIALSEMLRVTKPNGRCLILEFSLPDRFFKKPYLFYLRHIMPFLGGLVAKDAASYRYLNRTIEGFVSGASFLDWMRQTGWVRTIATPLLFGAVTLYRGDKT